MFLTKVLAKIKIRHVVYLYLVTAIISTIQSYHGIIHPATGYAGVVYHGYNNYILFKNSFFHLIQGKDLYAWYLNEQWDLYKYSPSFSLVFGLLAYLPDFIGLLFWSLLNTVPLLIGFIQLKKISDRNKIFALLFCLIELSVNLQNAQSNGLMAGLLILTFTSLENGKYFLAAFFVVFSIFIKIYGGIGFVFFLFYPGKLKLILYSLFWFVLLGFLPLVVIHLDQLLLQYKSWKILLKEDQSNSIGISVMGIIQAVFKLNIPKNYIVLTGTVIYLFPFLQPNKFKYYDYRLLVLCSTLIWVVIFNHKAESPTYIIALSGIAIWFSSRNKTRLNIILVILSFIFTTLITGDLFPHWMRDEYFKPYCIKALFSIIIFAVITYELLTGGMTSDKKVSEAIHLGNSA
jgi:Glycosyltransferase family 87